MLRILSWLTATLAVVAAITYYQANFSGNDEHAHGPAPAACGAPHTPTGATQTAQTTEASARDGAKADAAANDAKGDDPCANSEHTGKPGESK